MNYNRTILWNEFSFEKTSPYWPKLNSIKNLKKQKKPNASENNSTTAKVKNEKSYSVFIFLINENF